ncbi:MAG: hypothetical protein ABI325_02770 [Ginsengibacter sp.]
MIDISYDKLFSVELLHKYSADDVCNDFTIIPSTATKQLLSNYRIKVRQNGNILNAWINLDPTALRSTPFVKKPFIIPQEGLRLTFFMVLNNPLFFNYTNLPAANNNGNMYYFTNRNINNSNSKNFLTNNLKGFATGTYSFEDLIVNGGSVYQSLKNNNITTLPADLSDISSWRQVLYPDPNHPDSNIPDPNFFMSSEDLLRWMPSVSQLVSATPTTILVEDDNSNLVLTKTINPSFPLDISGLIPGKYFLTIGANPQISIYLNDELSNTQVFGVIDILVESTLTTGYKILNSADSSLLSPAYSIYFLNRATIWKYKFISTNNSVTITDSTDFYQFAQPSTPTSPTTILSQFAIPLSETPLTTLTLNGKSPPSPTADRFSKDPDDTNTKPVLFSEIFLNY